MGRGMKAMAKRKKDKGERREEALRPEAHLGYDRDHLAMYLMEREAYPIAESQFRRAIWLNPFEPRFKAHLAWCLYKQGKHAAAREWIRKALEQTPDNQHCKDIEELIEAARRDAHGHLA